MPSRLGAQCERRVNFTRYVACALILATPLLLDCGHTRQTSPLISAGNGASVEVQSYYDHLSNIVVEWWVYQTAFDTIEGVSTTKNLTDLYHERLVGIQARTIMAARLTSLYESLAQLRNTKSAEPTVTAAQNLGNSLNGLPKMPNIDLPTGLGQAAELLINIKRNRDFRAANNDLVGALAKISDLFAAEKEAYLSINRDRDRTRHSLIQALARRKLINTAPLLERLKLGVPWTTGTEDESTRKLSLAIDSVSGDRSMTAWSCATEETARVLNLLADGHSNIAKGDSASPASLLRAQTRAKDCITARDGLAQ
jgi:hypothetical protein